MRYPHRPITWRWMPACARFESLNTSAGWQGEEDTAQAAHNLIEAAKERQRRYEH